MLRIFIAVFCICTAWASGAVEVRQDSRITKMNEPVVVAEKFTFISDILGNKRTFYVHLPKGYHQSNDDYSVIYTTDGERRMLRLAAITHDLSIVAERIPPMIIIGIANDGTREENLSLLPSSMAFLKFITDELKPYIQKKYRTNNESLLFGSSAGGQFALRGLLETPDEFDAYVAISPSLFYNDYNLVKKAKKIALSKQSLNKSLYISLGNEGVIMGADELALNLAKYPIANLKWSFTKVEDESHGSISMKQSYDALQDYYASWAPAHFKNIRDFEKKGGLKAIEAKYADGIAGVLPYKVLNRIANLYFGAHYYQQGIDFSLLNIKNHPRLSSARRALAENYEAIGNLEKALVYYHQSLKIASLNQKAKKIKYYKNEIEKLDLRLKI